MSLSITSPLQTDLDDLMNLGGPTIEEHDTADPRFPFLVLIDTSASTNLSRNGNAPDIDRINAAITTMYRKLKNPPAGDPLALTNHQVDLCVVAYNTAPEVVQKWTPACDLPDTAPTFSAGGGTSTGLALLSAYEVMLARLSRYKAQGLPKSGKPHIIHLTDGEPTDVEMDNQAWRIVRERTIELTQTTQMLTLWNFVAPNGYDEGPRSTVDEQGNPLNGAKILERWLPAPVTPIGEGAENFTKFADLIVKTITAVSQQAGAQREYLGDQRSLVNDAF